LLISGKSQQDATGEFRDASPAARPGRIHFLEWMNEVGQLISMFHEQTIPKGQRSMEQCEERFA